MKIHSKYKLGIFFISFSTLLFELSLTRVFSVSLWYHFGFLIISTALLGFGVSGVLLSLWKKFRMDYTLDKTLGWIGLCLALSEIGSFWLLQKIPFDPFSLYMERLQLLYMPLTYLLVSIPFFFGGLALSLLFSRFPRNIHRLYAFDLAGAAAGCLAIVFTMSYLGGEGAVLFAAPIALFAALLFFGNRYKPLSLASSLLLISALFISFHGAQWIPLHITSNKRNPNNKAKPVFTKWNTFSRIDLFLDTSGVDPAKCAPYFLIDQGTAATGLFIELRPDVRTTLAKFPSDTLYSSCLAYLDKKNPDLLVIGSGCGTETLDALHHGVHQVTAVEINPIINDQTLHNPYWSDLFRQPEVKQVTAEGRSFVRSSKDKYDAILSVHTISNAAIASGALSLSENYALTREAFEDYYDHLRDSGLIYFTRPEFQLPRLFATGREALESKGVTDPARHFYAVTYPESVTGRYKDRKAFYSVFLMSKKALDREEVDSINAFVRLTNDPIPVVLYDPFKPGHTIYDSILNTTNLQGLYQNYPFEIEPATDDRPFFNHHTRWSSLNFRAFQDIFSQQRLGRMALEDRPITEVTLVILLVQVLIISSLLILLPLWRFSGRGLKWKTIFPFLFYFSGLGFGFILIEMTLIQLFSLLLGEPVYSFAIVLSALLLFTGVGAFISGKSGLNSLQTIKFSILALALLLLAASFFLPSLLRLGAAFSLSSTRVIFAILLIMPVGILLGMPFPAGMEILGRRAHSLIPWAWGVNGFATVIGSVAGIILSMMNGFQSVLWIAIGVYLVCMVLMTGKRGLGSLSND